LPQTTQDLVAPSCSGGPYNRWTGEVQQKEGGSREKERQEKRRGFTEGTDSVLHSPAIKDAENSYSQREYESLDVSNVWCKE